VSVFSYVSRGLVTGQYPVKESYQMSKNTILKPIKRRGLGLLSAVLPVKGRKNKIYITHPYFHI
jgi:hypothetical protein